jgi:hypothetical protein
MISSLVTSTVLSVLTASAFAQNVDKRLAKPVNANLTTIEIPLDPTAPDATEASVNQTVSYFAAKGHGDTPLAIVQGDVIISTVPELLSNASPVNGTNNALAKRSYSIWSTQNFWTGGVVHYKWLDEDAKGLGRLEAWTEATKRWTDHTDGGHNDLGADGRARRMLQPHRQGVQRLFQPNDVGRRLWWCRHICPRAGPQ